MLCVPRWNSFGKPTIDESMVKPRSSLFLIKKTSCVLTIVIVLFVLAGIVSQYHTYFPPDFQAPGFLKGRQAFFAGAYRIAFYSHVICGPFAILIGMYLYRTGTRGIRLGIHRALGKVQFLLIAIVLVPSGLVMATRAHTGVLAGAGFAFLSVFTMVSAIQAVAHIRQRDLIQHRRWASRLVILLLSPILLRILSMVFLGLGVDSHGTYQFSAWASWLFPLVIFEAWNRWQLDEVDRISSNDLEDLYEAVE